MNKAIEINELRQIQLEILDKVASFCEAKDLKYFLGYGTLIGAIRHKGYIPWDDDIDIVMPRPDYECFLSSFNDSNERLKVVSHGLNPNYTLPFAKVHDIRTSMHETMYKDTGAFGVYIDIFPLDGYGGEDQLKRIKKYSKLLNAKKAVIGSQRSFKKNLIIGLGKIVLFGISASKIVEKMEDIAAENDYRDSKLVKGLFSVYGDNEACEKEMIEETEFADFEGHQYRIPKNYDAYLRHIYGDYMQLPPVEKQVTHHTFIVWWKEESY